MIRVVTALLMACGLLVASSGVAAAQPATVFVVHGIPGADGFPVDISVTGTGVNACLPNVRFTQILGPVALPAGTYTIAIYGGGTGCSGGVALGPLDLSFMPGETAAVAAHLTAAGAPTAGKYAVDLSSAGPGAARVNVFHTAAAPEVDLVVARAYGRGNSPETKVTGIPNGANLSTPLRAGNWDVALLPAGGSTPAFGPVNVRVLPRTAYVVFAVGSLADGSFTLAASAVPVR
jgi:hypothetical protein